MKTYTKIEPWFEDCKRIIEDDWDNIELVTGEEGTGKSTWMRLVCRKLDPAFNVDRIHFTQEDYLDQARTLPPGSAIMLDEFKGHKRAAMHGSRLDFLDFLKECRGLNLHQKIGFPHVVQLDKDILRSRVRYWTHQARRGLAIIRQRQAEVRTAFDRKEGEKPVVLVRYPVVARFPWEDRGDPLKAAYKAKKAAHMKRDRLEESGQTKLLDPALLDRNLSAIPPVYGPAPRLNATFFDEVMADIQKAP